MKYSLKGKESVTLCKKKKVYKKPVIKKKKQKQTNRKKLIFLELKQKLSSTQPFENKPILG